MKEKVLVIPRNKLFTSGCFQGFSKENAEHIFFILETQSLFIPREKAEESPEFKQIIPYLLLKHQEKIFAVTRLSAQGESRLHEKVSIGLGGHINSKDLKPKEKPWESALKREVEEEVLIQGDWRAKWIGFLNDDETSVGKAHFGVVYEIESFTGIVEILETHKMKGCFLLSDEVERLYDRMESWSQYLFSALKQKNSMSMIPKS
ncbi:MAG: hypothetical protein M1421_03060 [Candidatus Eremiobacteraeota bacterium]|nr:hypothetical protein [Candidatus Eremiobacteraeota bacterium]MCL5056065.1 hypothetical protein [Bacillota bacterium]